MAIKSTVAPIKDRNWEDVLKRFGIEGESSDVYFDEGKQEAGHALTGSAATSSWIAKVVFFLGCTLVLGNVGSKSTLIQTDDVRGVIVSSSAGQQELQLDTNDDTGNFKKASLVKKISAKSTKETQALTLPTTPIVTHYGYEKLKPGVIWQTYVVKKHDRQADIFKKINQFGILNELRGIKPIEDALEEIKKDSIVRVQTHQGSFEKLVFTPDYKKSFVIEPTESGSFEGKWLDKQFEVRQARGVFSIENSLFTDAREVGIPDKVMNQVVTAFDWDIDFSKGIKKGDQVTIVFESLYHQGDLVGSLNLLAAEFINKGAIHRTIRHTTERGLTDFFAPDGREMKRAFVRTPVMRARVSSHFNPNRLHPVLNKRRAHTGTDFAAATGTPIIATGDGRVKFIGRKGGYGKTVILQHREGFTTLYSHLSKYKKDLKKGRVVAQGDVIGYVGSTGLATGPNLHYEFRKNNTPANPLTVKLPNSLSLTKKELAKFKVDAINMNLQLNVLHRFAKERVDISSAIGG